MKMRLLYLGLVPPAVGGKLTCGASIHSWELATNAKQRGYDVYFISNVIFESEITTIKGIKIIRMPMKKIFKMIHGAFGYLFNYNRNKNILYPFSLKERVAILGRLVFLKRILKIVKPDIIHIQGLIDWALSIRIVSSTIPIIISNHGQIEPIIESRDRNKKKAILKCANNIVLVSKYLGIKEKLLFDDIEKLTCVINNPIDPNKIPLIVERKVLQSNYRTSNKKIVFFSGICESIKVKGLDILLRAYEKSDMLRKTTVLFIIADKKGAKYANEAFLNYQINGKIFNDQPWDKIIQFYNLADVFVLPSRSEAFPLVFLESLLAGTPIVGFSDSVTELAELFECYIGEKYDAENETIDDLINKIGKVLNTSFDRSLLRARAIEKLSWNSKFLEFDSIYYSMMKKARA